MKKLIAIICCVLCACGKPGPSALDKKEIALAEAYVLIIRLQQEIAPTHPAYQDSLNARLARIGFGKEQFEAAVESLNKRPERWETFYEITLGMIEQKNKPADLNPSEIKDLFQ